MSNAESLSQAAGELGPLGGNFYLSVLTAEPIEIP